MLVRRRQRTLHVVVGRAWSVTDAAISLRDASAIAKQARRGALPRWRCGYARVLVPWHLASSPVVVACLTACASEEQELPVVMRGRYVEIASAREQPICGGTAEYMDRVIDAAFAVLGEVPPDRRFVRFEWLELDEDDPLIGGGLTKYTDDGALIRSDVYLVQEHELIHAVQHEAWPRTNAFLIEGHAVLLDAKRNLRDAYPWPEEASLDDLLEAAEIEPGDYDIAWFVVSQIVLDHGFDGLRELWHAVPRGSTAADVRATYRALFGRSIDALIEPYWVGTPGEPGAEEIERRACDFSLCPARKQMPWSGDQWTVEGPSGCADDPDAIGPDQRFYGEWGEVWYDYVLPGETGLYSAEQSAEVAFGVAGCVLRCGDTARGISSSFPGPLIWPAQPWLWDGRVRVEVRAASSDLPIDDPRTVTIVREPPP